MKTGKLQKQYKLQVDTKFQIKCVATYQLNVDGVN